MTTRGVHHVGLNVLDVEAAAAFFEEALGFERVGGRPEVDPDALDALHMKLAARADVRVEFAPEALGGGGARHMMFAGPSGVRLELVALP
ncbi:MAG: VOC family protein [Myxococcota bacterium]